ncbi:hypothetical protein [Nocardia alba]|uniref:DUF3806 domain-containing protein n=1 Tax=Nocardia alba TaxID=225051 RepID=A0A4R1G080_9NOCA|nr:hypothetical protein [Nocardia alba]TCK01004.1 hypothetical protein DFR71_2023 [Nocardia alba]
MGEDRPYSEIELRRLAKQQRSPEFRAWQEREAEDLAELISVVPCLADLDDPWTDAGLSAIEDAALARFPHIGEEATPEEMAYLALCARGIGHIYLRTMGEGHWVWVKLYESVPIGPAIELPGHTFWTDPGLSIRKIILYRNAGELVRERDRLIAWTREAAKRSMV